MNLLDYGLQPPLKRQEENKPPFPYKLIVLGILLLWESCDTPCASEERWREKREPGTDGHHLLWSVQPAVRAVRFHVYLVPGQKVRVE